jgi:hypothetical protein
MEESGIWLVEKKLCRRTKHRAGFYTTDPNLKDDVSLKKIFGYVETEL